MIKKLQKLLFFLLPFVKFKIEGRSMEPYLKEGDFVLANKVIYFFRKPKIGDIIAIKKDNKFIVKYIDKIKNNKYFVLGKNKFSKDSRHFGFITKKEIVGKVISL